MFVGRRGSLLAVGGGGVLWGGNGALLGVVFRWPAGPKVLRIGLRDLYSISNVSLKSGLKLLLWC